MLTIAACAALFFAACGDDDSTTGTTGAAGTTTERSGSAAAEPGTKPEVTVPDGGAPKSLEKEDIVVGEGAAAKDGDTVSVQYVGVGYDSEEEFDASWDRGEPFAFQLGSGQVIPGWEEGVVGMKVGGRRELRIPPDLAYGAAGSPPSIGPDEALVFVVDLEAIE